MNKGEMMERKKQKVLDLSMSRLLMFMKCPYSYYLRYKTELPGRTDYKRELGTAIHSIVEKMHKGPSTRPFYYKTKNAAANACSGLFRHNVCRKLGDLNWQIITSYEDEAKRQISNYWDDNVDRGRPVSVEERHDMLSIISGVNLTSKIDQVRIASLDWISKYLPELVEDRELKDRYSQEVVLDIKSGEDYLLPYFVRKSEGEGKKLALKTISPEKIRELALAQLHIHVAIQPTIYLKLRQEKTGKEPVAFVYYYTRTRRLYLTRRDPVFWDELIETIKDIVFEMENEVYRKQRSYCRLCDYKEECYPASNMYISLPTSTKDIDQVERIETTVSSKGTQKAKQLKFKMKIEKIKKPKIEQKIKKRDIKVLGNINENRDE